MKHGKCILKQPHIFTNIWGKIKHMTRLLGAQYKKTTIRKMKVKLPAKRVFKSVVNFEGNTLTALNAVHLLNISNISSPCSVCRSTHHTSAMRWFARIGKNKTGIHLRSRRISALHCMA